MTALVVYRYVKKAWSFADHPIEVPINNQRLGRTIIAAIGKELHGGCFSIEDTTNAEMFLRFLRQLKAQLRASGVHERVWLVMDNHSVSAYSRP